MKITRIMCTGIAILCYTISPATDILTFRNNMSFKGDVVKIKACTVKFKTEHAIYFIPADSIDNIIFENPQDKVLVEYAALEDDADKCLKGRNDADMFHGKKGKHIALGILFGPFAVIGSAIASPKPKNGKDTFLMSKNKDLFSDPMYLNCYKKKARGKNVGNTAIGWGIWIVFLLAI